MTFRNARAGKAPSGTAFTSTVSLIPTHLLPITFGDPLPGPASIRAWLLGRGVSLPARGPGWQWSVSRQLPVESQGRTSG